MAAAAKKAASSNSGGTVLKVSAPLVQVQIGTQVLHLSNGDIVPDGVSKEQIAHLSELGYVAEGDAPNSSDDE